MITVWLEPEEEGRKRGKEKERKEEKKKKKKNETARWILVFSVVTKSVIGAAAMECK